MEKVVNSKITGKTKFVFGNANFRYLFSGKIISQLGDQIYNFALSWFILDLTKSSFQMAVFLIINFVVMSVISPLSGVLADKFNKKHIIVAMEIVQGLIMVLMFVLFSGNMIKIWMLYISSVLLSVCGSLLSPTASAVIPDVVDENQLTQAVSVDNFSGSLCIISGMVLGGILYSGFGVAVVILIDAISFFIGGLLIFMMKGKFNKTDHNKKINMGLSHFFNDMKEGYKYIKENKAVYYLLLLVTVFNFIAYPLGMLYIPYTFNVVLHSTPLQLSLALGSLWIGVMLGSIIVPIFLKNIKLKTNLLFGLIVCSLSWFFISAYLFFSFNKYINATNWDITIFFIIESIILGFSLSCFNIPVAVLFQKKVSEEFRGRFWGINASLTTLAIAAGYLLGGVLAQNVWVVYLYFGSAIIMILVNLWISNVKVIRELTD